MLNFSVDGEFEVDVEERRREVRRIGDIYIRFRALFHYSIELLDCGIKELDAVSTLHVLCGSTWTDVGQRQLEGN